MANKSLRKILTSTEYTYCDAMTDNNTIAMYFSWDLSTLLVNAEKTNTKIPNIFRENSDMKYFISRITAEQISYYLSDTEHNTESKDITEFIKTERTDTCIESLCQKYIQKQIDVVLRKVLLPIMKKILRSISWNNADKETGKTVYIKNPVKSALMDNKINKIANQSVLTYNIASNILEHINSKYFDNAFKESPDRLLCKILCDALQYDAKDSIAKSLLKNIKHCTMDNYRKHFIVCNNNKT